MSETQPDYSLVIPGTKKAGFLKRIVCLALFTQDEVVIAHISNEKITQAVKEAGQRAKEAGQGMFARVAAQMGATQALINSYQTRSVADIAADDPTNLVLPNASVREVRFKPSTTSHDSDGDSSRTPGYLKLRSDAAAVELILTDLADRDKRVRQCLSSLFGSRLR